MISARLMTGFMIAAAPLGSAAMARGDEVLLGRIPISSVQVRGIDECHVTYTMTGRLNQRAIDRVVLHLDSIPALEKAEDAAEQQHLDQSMALLDEAMKQATEHWQKSWIYYRRTRILNDAGHYTRACQSWATLLLTSIDACWVDAMPTCAPDHPDQATADAALEQLRKVREQAKDESVMRDLVDLAIRTISDIDTSETAQRQPSPELQPSSTGDALKEDGAKPQAAKTAADDLDDLIAAGKVSQARTEIEEWVANTRQYPLDRLLYQYGQVLAAQRESRDAAIRYLQCAILFPDSAFAASSLYEAARLHAGPLNDLAAARRLLDHAQSAAEGAGQAALIEKINTARNELNSRK